MVARGTRLAGSMGRRLYGLAYRLTSHRLADPWRGCVFDTFAGRYPAILATITPIHRPGTWTMSAYQVTHQVSVRLRLLRGILDSGYIRTAQAWTASASVIMGQDC